MFKILYRHVILIKIIVIVLQISDTASENYLVFTIFMGGGGL